MLETILRFVSKMKKNLISKQLKVKKKVTIFCISYYNNTNSIHFYIVWQWKCHVINPYPVIFFLAPALSLKVMRHHFSSYCFMTTSLVIKQTNNKWWNARIRFYACQGKRGSLSINFFWPLQFECVFTSNSQRQWISNPL